MTTDMERKSRIRLALKCAAVSVLFLAAVSGAVVAAAFAAAFAAEWLSGIVGRWGTIAVFFAALAAIAARIVYKGLKEAGHGEE